MMNYLRLLQLRRAAGDGGGAGSGADAGGAAGTDAGSEAQSAAGSPEGGGTTGTEGADKGEKSFTQADIDRIVQTTIAKERARADKAVLTAKTEAERLARMSEDERATHEREEREKALNARETDLNRRELRATALQTLAEKGLPAELADTLDYADADKCNASIGSIEKVFRAAVQKGVESRMAGSAPSAGAAGSSEAAMFAKMRKAAGLK